MTRWQAAGVLLAFAVFTSCDGQLRKNLPGAPAPSDKLGAAVAPPVVAEIGGLLGPESVLHDPEQDVYFISNINGGLLAADNNGFITRVDAKTMRVDLRWIAAGSALRLDAPKGMAIAGDSLYVADIGGVRRFDRRSGRPAGEIALPGTTLVNDVTTDGRSLYVSDTAVRPGPGITFVATGTDAIWKITDGRAEKIAGGEELQQPNGIAFARGALWVAGFRGNRVFRLDGKRAADRVELPRGQLDGLVVLPDGTRLATSWIGTTIYRERGGEFAPLLTGVTTPADIGYDTARRRLLVPRTALNVVTIHQMAE